MFQLAITTLIALLVKSPRTALMWSFIIPIFMLGTIATTIGNRFVPAAAVMVFICPVVTTAVHAIKAYMRKKKDKSE